MEVAAARADDERLASRLRKEAYAMMSKLSFFELCSYKTICQGMMNFPPLSFHSSKMLWGLLRANSVTLRPLVTKVFRMLNSKSTKIKRTHKEKFIVLDAHLSSCTLAVVGPNGKKLKTDVVETNGEALAD